MTAWDGIEEFVAVATQGSFATAAKFLGVSPSHVSRAVHKLEGRVQGAVFFRTTRSVRLTSTGQVLLEQCQRLIKDRDEALALACGEGTLHGDLRITCSISLGERFVVPIIRRFAEEHPQLKVNIDLTNRMVDLVAEGFDLAVRTGQLLDSRLIGARIGTREHVLCGAPQYLARAGTPKSIDQLADHDCLIGTASTWRFQLDGEASLFRPKGRWRCNSGAAIADAAAAGLGLCQLPKFYVLPYIRSGRLQAILPDIQVVDEPIWAVYPQRRHLQPKVRELLQRLRLELAPAMRAQRPE